MKTDPRDPVVSLSRKDFDWHYFSGSGAGGQNRNKHQNCVRLMHRPSQTMAVCQDFKERRHNERKAFERLTGNPTFRLWLKVEHMKRIGRELDLDVRVDQLMASQNLRIERKTVVDGKEVWAEWNDEDATERDPVGDVRHDDPDRPVCD